MNDISGFQGLGFKINLGFTRLFKLLQTIGISETVKFTWRWITSEDLVQVKVKNITFPMSCRKSGSDIHVLWHVFGERDCEIELHEKPQFIIDGGAYVGYTSIYFANEYPGAMVVAIEPDKENFALLCRNVKPYPSIIPINAALWSSNIDLTITNPEAQSWSFKVAPIVSQKTDIVCSVTLPDIFQQFGFSEVGLLKLDVEGAEQELFRPPFGQWLDLVQAIIIEPHGAEAEKLLFSMSASLNFETIRNGEKIIMIKSEISD